MCIRDRTSIASGFSICVIMYVFFGLSGLIFYIGAVLGFQYTSVSGNYAQHYGLETLPIPDSEKVVFAWDDSGVIGKYTHFNLHIHSDHHSNALKSFDKLRNIKGRPLLPYSLPTMMMLFPFPIFEKIMNKRLEEYCDKLRSRG
jgi:alkane 1-monooxygenase